MKKAILQPKDRRSKHNMSSGHTSTSRRQQCFKGETQRRYGNIYNAKKNTKKKEEKAANPPLKDRLILAKM